LTLASILLEHRHFFRVHLKLHHLLEALRAELITIVDDHLSDLQSVPRIVYGEPFHFMRSTIIEVPSGVRARTLAEFREGLRRVDLSAIYYHFFEPRGRRDPAAPAEWLEDELGEDQLAAQVRRLNPYISSLDGLRDRLLAMCDQRLGAPRHA